jgi:endogenous inhibitor of DNA gyrase (YacG/DUF329 family)
VIENAPNDFETRPFCSQRCKLADLDNWLKGAYRISSPLRQGDPVEDEYKLNN